MAIGNGTMIVAGNLARDPELRYTPTGQAVASFTVASTPRWKDSATGEWKDGETLWQRCNVWRQPAENVCESLKQGDRVVVIGTLKQRKWTDKEGAERISYELEAEEVSASLRNASVKITKTARSNGGNGGGQQAPPPEDPWATANQGAGPGRSGSQKAAEDPWAGDDDQPPF